MINKKHKDGVMQSRIPVLACSNYSPWQYIPEEKQTLLNRCFYYEFIKHEEFAE